MAAVEAGGGAQPAEAGDPPSGRSVLASLGLWALLAVVAVGATLIGARILAASGFRVRAADVVALALLETYLALLAGLVVAHGGPARARRRLRLRFTSVGDLAIAETAWIAALVVGGLLTALLVPLLGAPSSNAEPVLKLSFDPFFVALVVPTVCLLAPLAEELLFRGALLGWLGTRVGVWAVPLSAGLFAVAHLLPALLPVLFSFGIATALVARGTRSTLNSFAMHATQNTVAVVATYALIARGG